MQAGYRTPRNYSIGFSNVKHKSSGDERFVEIL